MAKNDYTEMVKNEIFSRIPLTREDQINSYIGVMKDEIKETYDKFKLEAIYREIVIKCRLEGIEVPVKLERAIKSQNESVDLKAPEYLEGVKFDKYSILPNVRRKQYWQNQDTIERLQKISKYGTDELYQEYRKELKSGQPDRNILTVLENRREDIRATAKNVIDMVERGRYVPRELGNTPRDVLSNMDGRLSATEHAFRTRFSPKKSVIKREIEDEFDNGHDRFEERVEKIKMELRNIPEDRKEGSFSRYLEDLIEETKREEQEAKNRVEIYKRNEESKAVEKARQEEMEAQRKIEKQEEDMEEAIERSQASSLEENMMHSNNVFGL